MTVRRAVRDLLPGDHAWLPFHSAAEQGHVIGAWIRQGLAIEDKIIYVTDNEPWELPGLFGENLRPHITSGLLTLVPVGEACLTGGMFDPAKLVTTLADEIAKAEQEQYRGIRVTADVSWALREPFGDTRLDACERQFGRAVCPSVSVTAICQTDLSRCAPDQYGMLCAHHEVIAIPDPDFDDPVLSITRTYRPLGLRLKGELDGARRTHFASALHAVTPNGQTVHLDLAELDFIALDALSVLVDYSRGRGPQSRVVLHRAAPSVRSVISALGAERLRGIDLEND